VPGRQVCIDQIIGQDPTGNHLLPESTSTDPIGCKDGGMGKCLPECEPWLRKRRFIETSRSIDFEFDVNL
jgi:hypothetical protein